jgi:hypothetical protein
MYWRLPDPAPGRESIDFQAVTLSEEVSSAAPGWGNSIVMTGADGGAGRGDRPGWQWDVALSFAGVQRDYVEQVAQALQARGCTALRYPRWRKADRITHY